MSSDETLARARVIFTSGRKIRDHISRLHNDHFAARGKGDTFRGLSLDQINAIHAVRMHKEVYMTELSAFLDVSPPSASAMVDRLVDKGILARKHCVKDRRKVMVSISPSVEKDIEEVEKALLGSFMDLVRKIGPETSRKWCEVMEQIVTKLKL